MKENISKSINGVDLTNLSSEEKYQLGLQDGLSFSPEVESEKMKEGLAAEGDYLRGLLEGIQKNPEQQELAKSHR